MRRLIPVAMAIALIGALVIGGSTATAGKRTTKITVGNNFFDPSSKKIKKGTKVKFKWAGGVPHNVKKRKGPGGKFKSKTTAKKGVQFKKKFKKKGTYKLVCTIHPRSMRLKLKVR